MAGKAAGLDASYARYYFTPEGPRPGASAAQMEPSSPSTPLRPRPPIARHGAALFYIMKHVLPAIARTGRRPVIFSRWSGMGDIISTFPAALELRRRHPGSRFIYNCDPHFAALAHAGGVADECTSFPEVGVIGHWHRFLLAGFYHFAHGDDVPGTFSREPMFVEFCRQFGVAAPGSHPSLAVDAAALGRVKALLAARNVAAENLILFHTGPTWPVKEWPAEHWAALADGLRSGGYPNLAQAGLGAYMASQQTQLPHSLGHTVDLGAASVPAIPGAVSLLDALSLGEIIGLISLARLVVGIDSGLLHIAACVRTPAVGIFGPTLPAMFYEEKVRANFVGATVDCAGCHHRVPRLHWITGCPYDVKCMKQIPPGEVLRACLAALA